MLSLIPIVVGVTGKRELKGMEERVRQRLDEIFLEIEQRFPNSPLVLATGLAKGADLLAAEVALTRSTRQWTIVGVLPFKQELFLEDFSSEEDVEWREKLKGFLDASNPKFLLKVLKPLRSTSGKPFEDDELRRTSDNAARRRHYEQVGLFIADRCGLLVAVMPFGEEPAKVGGTARIARYKREGKLDTEAARTVQDSQEIAVREPLDGEMRGIVEVIDPDATRRAMMGEQKKGDERYTWMMLDRIEAYNKSVREREATSDGVPAAWQLLDDKKDDAVGDYVSRLRSELSQLQGRAKDRLSRSMWSLALLFVASITILEIFAKLFPDAKWLFLGYALIVGCGLGLFYWVRRKHLQAFVEDYRGGAEALRVQVEWWRLGLRGPTHRVDRYYLVGGEGHFAVLRGGIKAVLDAALLLASKPHPLGQSLELDPEKRGLRRRDFWIPSQIDFFRKRSDSKHRTAIRLSSLAWYLFQTSVGIGLAIGMLMLLRASVFLEPVLKRLLALTGEYRQGLSIVTFGLSALWIALFLIWVRSPEQSPLAANATLWERMRHFFWYRRLLGMSGQHSGGHGWLVALILGVLIVPAVVAFAMDQTPESAGALQSAEKISLVLMIVLAAASGAVRFVVERSALEAEAISYRETLQSFKAAQDRAREVRSRAGHGLHTEAMVIKSDQELGLALGRVALAENEAWLRAHRQRPLEPLS